MFRLIVTRGLRSSGYHCKHGLTGRVLSSRFVSGSQSQVTTMQDVMDSLYNQLGGQKLWSRPNEYDRSHLLGILPTTQDELPPRRMSDSYDEVLLPIGDDEVLREKYVSYMGGVRLGRILEDMDIFSVWVCYRYVLNPHQKPGDQSPFCIVTGLVDQIDLAERVIKADENVKFTGNVSWVGKTSIEATMRLHQMRNNSWQELIKARFVMVARDPLNRGAAFVNPLVVETNEERAIFEEGQVNNRKRKQLANESLLKVPPTEDERALIHNMFLETLDPTAHSFSVRVKPVNTEWMENSKLKNVIICHPQDRNLFNKIFGGFLMHQAAETAIALSQYYSKSRPFIIHVDDIWFRKPVEIGSLLYFASQVVYTEGSRLQIRVNASVVDPVMNVQETTNVFYFTFTTDPGVTIKQVIPKTYSEAMLYLDGKRHYDAATGLSSYS